MALKLAEKFYETDTRYVRGNIRRRAGSTDGGRVVWVQPFPFARIQIGVRGSPDDDTGCQAVYGWDFFRISRTDYARHLEDLKYENIRGDQTTSIDAKAMLQLIVYGAWNNLGLDDALPIAVKGEKPFTISDIFDMSG